MRRAFLAYLSLSLFSSILICQGSTEKFPGKTDFLYNTTVGATIQGGGVSSGIFNIPFSGSLRVHDISGDTRISMSGSKSFLEANTPSFTITSNTTPSAATYFMRFSNDNAAGGLWDIGMSLGDFGEDIVFRPNESTVVASLTANGIFQNSSDRRLKENIIPIHSALESLLKVKASKYNRKTTPGQQEFGFIAQEIEKIYPEMVSKIKNDNGEETYLMGYTQMIPVLTKAMQEQQEIIENQSSAMSTQKDQIRDLISIIESLQRRVTALEK